MEFLLVGIVSIVFGAIVGTLVEICTHSSMVGNITIILVTFSLSFYLFSLIKK